MQWTRVYQQVICMQSPSGFKISFEVSVISIYVKDRRALRFTLGEVIHLFCIARAWSHSKTLVLTHARIDVESPNIVDNASKPLVSLLAKEFLRWDLLYSLTYRSFRTLDFSSSFKLFLIFEMDGLDLCLSLSIWTISIGNVVFDPCVVKIND